MTLACETCRYFVPFADEPFPVPEVPKLIPNSGWFSLFASQPFKNHNEVMATLKAAGRARRANERGLCHWSRDAVEKRRDSFCRHHDEGVAS